MKRALILLALLCGCGSAIPLGSLPPDAGAGADMTCPSCSDMFLPTSDMFVAGQFDLAPGDLAFTFDLR